MSALVTRDRPLYLSLPSNPNFNSLLASLSTQLTNKYLITRVIECATDHPGEWSGQFDCPPHSYIQSSSTQLSRGSAFGLDTDISRTITPLCTIAKPFIWYRDDSVYGELL
ncbi:hypothetical protein SCLCIDRAFT_804582 [Scleroderma citrinum Foug A]|uniref:Uncharacterized protein n=1 Tax=Scleroderma citrinum Foug A TaxID=1036808 RepID=A0A0C2ZLP4_9AGAM|nr:hypothetical protein SCLCIDRAFT_804582 [Scleroderma citrinum Foug A]